MPWKGVPEDEIEWAQAACMRRGPHDGGRGLGKTGRSQFGPARAARGQAGKHVGRQDAPIDQMAQQDALGGHGHAREVAALIAQGLADEKKPGAAAALEVLAELRPSNVRRPRKGVVLLVSLKPGIEHATGSGRAFKRLEQLFDFSRHKS